MRAAALVVFLILLVFTSPTVQDRQHALEGPNLQHIFGTDDLGRDQFARFLYGGLVSAGAALIATSLSLLIGALAGSIAGYRRGALDQLIMACTDVFLALPWLYALLAFRASLPLEVHPITAFFLIASLLGCIGWASTARLVRNTVSALVLSPYVEASRGFGASTSHILRYHLLPAARIQLVAQWQILFSHYLLAEITLSFLGLGIGEPTPSWGQLLLILRQPALLAQQPYLALPIFSMGLMLFLMKRFGRSADL